MIKVLIKNIKIFLIVFISLFVILFFSNSELTKKNGYTHVIKLRLYIPQRFQTTQIRTIEQSVYNDMMRNKELDEYKDYKKNFKYGKGRFLYTGNDPNVSEKARKFANEFLKIYDSRISLLESKILENLNKDNIQLELGYSQLVDISISSLPELKFKSFINKETLNKIEINYRSIIVNSLIVSFVISLCFIFFKEIFFRIKKLI